MATTDDAKALTEEDSKFLRHCIELAREGLRLGNPPFGSILVDENHRTVFKDWNQTSEGDPFRHPEFSVARWAVSNLTPEERRKCTVYTSGEHCPMCIGAHVVSGLDRIVYAASGEQLSSWRRSWGAPSSAFAPLSIDEVAPSLTVAGPDPKLTSEIRDLHARWSMSR